MAFFTSKKYSQPNVSDVIIRLSPGSLLNGALKDQEFSFIQVMGQLAEGKMLKLPGQGQEISLEDNMTGATLALNKWLADTEAINLQLWKIFNFEQKMADQINSFAA